MSSFRESVGLPRAFTEPTPRRPAAPARAPLLLHPRPRPKQKEPEPVEPEPSPTLRHAPVQYALPGRKKQVEGRWQVASGGYTRFFDTEEEADEYMRGQAAVPT